MQAGWWRPEYAEDGTLAAARCGLCPHSCRIAVGNSGLCGVRSCDENGLASPYLGLFSSLAVDPIEKKPLFHWRPGSLIRQRAQFGGVDKTHGAVCFRTLRHVCNPIMPCGPRGNRSCLCITRTAPE